MNTILYLLVQVKKYVASSLPFCPDLCFSCSGYTRIITAEPVRLLNIKHITDIVTYNDQYFNEKSDLFQLFWIYEKGHNLIS